MTFQERIRERLHKREVAQLEKQARQEATQLRKEAIKEQDIRRRAQEREQAAERIRNLQKSRSRIAKERTLLEQLGRKKGKKGKGIRQRLSKLRKKDVLNADGTLNISKLQKALQKL